MLIFRNVLLIYLRDLLYRHNKKKLKKLSNLEIQEQTASLIKFPQGRRKKVFLSCRAGKGGHYVIMIKSKTFLFRNKIIG